MLVYFAQYNLGNVELMAYMNFIIIGSSFLGVVFLPKLVKMFGKKRTAMIGFGISVAADLINFMSPSNVYVFTILASIAFIGISIPNGITWALVSDIIDYGEWKSGERKEATTYSLLISPESLLSHCPVFSRASVWGLSAMCRMQSRQQRR